MRKIKYDTIIISDIHFGQPNCKSKELFIFLNSIEVGTLILNGDIFNDLNFFRLKHWDWRAFSQIRQISDHCKVIWNQGNHDTIDEIFMSCLLGVYVHKGYYWSYKGKAMYAVHGHKWDVFIYRYKTLTAILTWVYDFIQRKSFRWSEYITKWIKNKSKALIRNCEMIRKNAIKMAKENKIKVIICGHTHKAELCKIRGIIYANSGTWESDTPHFIGIKGNGNREEVQLIKYEQGGIKIIKTLKIGDIK